MRLGLCVSASVEVADGVCQENVAIKTATSDGIPSTPRAGVSLASGSIRDIAAINVRAATGVRCCTYAAPKRSKRGGSAQLRRPHSNWNGELALLPGNLKWEAEQED